MCFFPLQTDEDMLSLDNSSAHPCHKQINFSRFLKTQGFWKLLLA